MRRARTVVALLSSIALLSIGATSAAACESGAFHLTSADPSSIDGGLTITVDALGSFGSEVYGEGVTYNPIGDIEAASTVFLSQVLFADTGTVLHDCVAAIADTVSSTPSSVVSKARIGDWNLTLTQTVSFRTGHGSSLVQTYDFVNASSRTAENTLVRHIDSDLYFDETLEDGGAAAADGAELYEYDSSDDVTAPSTYVGIAGSLNGDRTPDAWTLQPYNYLERILESEGIPRQDHSAVAFDHDQDLVTDEFYDVTLSQQWRMSAPPGGRRVFRTITRFGLGAPDEVATQCGAVHVVGARGSDEDPLDLTRMGQTLTSFTDGLERSFPSDNVSREGVRYPAVPAWTAFADLTGGIVNADWRPFQRSVEEGRTNLIERMDALLAACPSTQFVVAGYSQGAAVVGDAADELVRLEGASRIRAMVLFGDPYFRPSSATAVGGGGTFFTPTTGVVAERAEYSDAVQGVLRSYCRTLDPICSFYPPLGAGPLGFSALRWGPHFKYINGEIQQGVRFAGRQLRTDVGTLSATQAVGAVPNAVIDDGGAAPMNQPVMLAAGSSSDTDGVIVRYDWDLDGRGGFEHGSTGSTILHTFTSAGPHQVRLRVLDDDGNSDIAQLRVEVDGSLGAPPRPPGNVRATSAPRAVTISWTRPSYETQGFVLHDTEGGLLGIAPPEAETFSLLNLPAGHTIRATVASIGRTSAGGPSRVVSATSGERSRSGPVSVDRRSGSTRAGTAARLAHEAFPLGAGTVVIARQDDYADALAGAPLAAGLMAPILLSDGDALSAEAKDAIQTLRAHQAILLGTLGRSEAIQQQLAAMEINVTAVRGSNRFATAHEIALRIGGSEAYLVRGNDSGGGSGWPDAVVAAVPAGAGPNPILLTERDRLPDETAIAIEELGLERITVIGGRAAISDDVLSQVEALGVAVERVSGPTRYATSIEAAQLSVTRGNSLGEVWIASGRVFPDALAAGPAAGVRGAVLILTDGTDEAGSREVTRWLAEHRADIGRVVLVGGASAISPAVEGSVQRAISDNSSPP